MATLKDVRDARDWLRERFRQAGLTKDELEGLADLEWYKDFCKELGDEVADDPELLQRHFVANNVASTWLSRRSAPTRAVRSEPADTAMAAPAAATAETEVSAQSTGLGSAKRRIIGQIGAAKKQTEYAAALESITDQDVRRTLTRSDPENATKNELRAARRVIWDALDQLGVSEPAEVRAANRR